MNHRSEAFEIGSPPPLSLVLGRTCRNVHVVSLPRLRVARHAVRFRSLSPSGSAWGYAGRLAFTRFRLFALLRRYGFL